MPKDRLVVPDLLQQMPNANPAVRPSDSYTYPPYAAQPGHPIDNSENSLLRLGNTLSGFEPELATVASIQHKTFTDEEAAKGEAAYHENRMTWNDLVKNGKVPLGASPYFTKAYQQSQLRDNAADYAQVLSNAYQNDQTGIQTTDDPAKLRTWLGQQAQAYRESKFRNPDGSLAFSPLDIKEVFDPLQQDTNNSLLKTHVHNRVQDHEATGIQTASTEIGKVLDYYGQGGYNYVDGQHYEDVGKRINDTLFAPVTGLVANGLNRTVANNLMVDGITQYAVRTGDRGALNILDNISTGSGKLGGTTYAKQKRYEAELHITDQNWKDETRDRMRQDWTVQGTLQERLQKKDQDQQRSDQTFAQQTEKYNREMESYARLDTATANKRRIDSEKGFVVAAVLAKDPFNPLVAPALKRLAALDPDAAKTMSDWLDARVKAGNTFTQTPEGTATFNDIRRDMSENPEQFNSNRIHKGGTENLLSDSQVAQLWDDWDRLRTNMDHPFLKNRVYQNALDAVAKGISSDPNFSQKGEGAVIAANAQYAFRAQAQQWIADHKDAKLSDFNDYIDKSLRPTVLKNNKEMMDNEQARQKKLEEDAAKRANPEVVEKPRSLTDKLLMRPKQYETVAPPPEPKSKVGDGPLTRRDLKTLLDGTPVWKEMQDMATRVNKQGKDGVKPPHESEVRALLRKAYEPIYNTYRPGERKELIDAIESSVDVFMGRKKKETNK